MPELPEVETLRRELDKALAGKTVKSAKALWPKAVLPLSVKQFEMKLKNQKITEVNRRAKMLILNFSKDLSLVFHLKMTGQVIFVPQKGEATFGGHPTNDVQTPGKHTRLILEFTNGDHLYFNDMRKFGWAKLLTESELDKITSHSGPEPLGKDFTDNFLIDLFSKYPNRTIKQILLDQTLIAGIGNIYADEASFLSGLMPNRKVGTIKKEEIIELRKQIVSVLKLSISKGGTSARDYRRSDGSKGNFISYLKVYGREKEPCKKCGREILKMRHVGRGTHYCPHCQR